MGRHYAVTVEAIDIVGTNAVSLVTCYWDRSWKKELDYLSRVTYILPRYLRTDNKRRLLPETTSQLALVVQNPQEQILLVETFI